MYYCWNRIPNAILVRLFLRPLISIRQEGFQSAKIIFIDDRGRNNNWDSIVHNFTLKYGPTKKWIEYYSHKASVYNLPIGRLAHIPIGVIQRLEAE